MAKKSKSEVGAAAESFGVNLAEIERLLTFMQSHGLEELEYQRGDLHVRLKKASAVGALAPFTRMEGHASVPLERQAPPAPPPSAPAGSAEHAPTDNLHTIKSPIVGTFYASPSPEADAFVAVGAQVEPGTVLCIIEAMKLMNEIESDIAGEVVRIHVENGKPVEYGAPLFDIRPRSAGKK